MALENKIRILATDVLGTLVHLPSESDSSIPAGDLIEVGSRRYIHRQTQHYLQQIREAGITVVLLSGMRLPSYRDMMSHLPYDYAAIEDGSVLYQDGRREVEWDKRLAVELVTLQSYKESLAGIKLKVDDLDRAASFRVDPNQNYRGGDLEKLTQDFPELNKYPPELRRTVHTPYPPSHPCYQFVPASSGKANALAFILAGLPSGGIALNWDNVSAFGDDLNDKDMLEKAALSMTLIANNNSTIQKLVVDKKGILAPAYSHAGTAYALSKLLEMAKPV